MFIAQLYSSLCEKVLLGFDWRRTEGWIYILSLLFHYPLLGIVHWSHHFSLLVVHIFLAHSQHWTHYIVLCCTHSHCGLSLSLPIPLSVCWAAARIGLYTVWWSIFIKLWHMTTPGICMGRVLMKRKGFHFFVILIKGGLCYTI